MKLWSHRPIGLILAFISRMVLEQNLCVGGNNGLNRIHIDNNVCVHAHDTVSDNLLPLKALRLILAALCFQLLNQFPHFGFG